MVKDENGERTSGMFSYSSIVGILLNMSENICPDIFLAVSICSRYMFSPKRSHELILKILSQYLNQTRDHGLVLSPNDDVCKWTYNQMLILKGMYENEESDFLACVKSRT